MCESSVLFVGASKALATAQRSQQPSPELVGVDFPPAARLCLAVVRRPAAGAILRH